MRVASAGNSSISLDNGSIPGDGNTAANITVTLRDSGNNPVGGKTVSLGVSGGSSSVSPGNGVSDTNGVVAFQVRDGNAEAVTYTGIDVTDNVVISGNVTVYYNSTATATPTNTPGPGNGTFSINGAGALVLTLGSVSASGSASVNGTLGPNTGVTDYPGGWNPPTAPAGAPAAPPIDPGSFPGGAPAAISATVSTSSGGIVMAGNVAVLLPPAALTSVAGGKATISIQPNPQVIIPGGPAQFSPNGSILSISISDANGAPVTSFPSMAQIEFKYNAADIGQASGNVNVFTAAYVIAPNSPQIANPNGYPPGTFVIFPPQNVSLYPAGGTITVNAQAFGSVVTVITNPVGYVQTLKPDTPELSNFDPSKSTTFSTQPQFTYLQVVEPQIGTRLMVIDPATHNYSYVNATDVGPSAAPPR